MTSTSIPAGFDPIRAALSVMLYEAKQFNTTVLRDAGIGPFDLGAIRQAEAALNAPILPVDTVPSAAEAACLKIATSTTLTLEQVKSVAAQVVKIDAVPGEPVDEAKERKRFEAHMRADGWLPPSFAKGADGHYTMHHSHNAWIGWLAAKADATPPAPAKGDNARCKFANGGAKCVSHCGDPVCLGSQP